MRVHRLFANLSESSALWGLCPIPAHTHSMHSCILCFDFVEHVSLILSEWYKSLSGIKCEY